MITYQACGLNKKIDKSNLVEFFGWGDVKDLNSCILQSNNAINSFFVLCKILRSAAKNSGCPLFFYALVQIPPFYFQNKKDIFKSFRMDLNLCATSRREACMESMQSIVWNPLQDGMESSRRKCTFGDTIHADA